MKLFLILIVFYFAQMNCENSYTQAVSISDTSDYYQSDEPHTEQSIIEQTEHTDVKDHNEQVGNIHRNILWLIKLPYFH